jgi:hypothetical protein
MKHNKNKSNKKIVKNSQLFKKRKKENKRKNKGKK